MIRGRSTNVFPGDRTLGKQRGEGGQPAIRVAIIDTTLRPHDFLKTRDIPPNPQALRERPPSFRSGHGTFVTGVSSAGRRRPRSPWKACWRRRSGKLLGRRECDLGMRPETTVPRSSTYPSPATRVTGSRPWCFPVRSADYPRTHWLSRPLGTWDGMNHAQIKYSGIPDLSQAPAWPAASPNVVGVGAADRPRPAVGRLQSNRAWVDVLAPGVDVASIFPGGIAAACPANGGYATWNGTSFSAAEFTGAVAGLATPRTALRGRPTSSC